MLFNSAPFLLYFLPIVLGGFLVLAWRGARYWAGLWITGASLVFYGSWNLTYVPLLVGSLLFNYFVGTYLARHRQWPVLAAGIALNIAVLVYYKYTGFLIEVARDLTGADLAIPVIVLPLALSFFTFQQIAYLVDAYDGVAEEHDLGNYALFITFFPHLIAGPITHHREMLPQFTHAGTFRPRWDWMALGASLFVIGLFKKVEIADRLGEVARPVFAAASAGQAMTLFDAWGGAIGYALQVYFDFSGYTDMAIGLGLLFCIRLPQNFNSPYKAVNVIDFWSRWHMTLTRFLTTYVYNPLTASLTRARARRGLPLPRGTRMPPRLWLVLVAVPTMLTMLISGVWHGAGWQFVIFGLLHGFYLAVNHAWLGFQHHRARLRQAQGRPARARGALATSVLYAASVGATFICVVVAAVFFRSDSAHTGFRIVQGMLGLGGGPPSETLQHLPIVSVVSQLLGVTIGARQYVFNEHWFWIAVLLVGVWTLPNAQQWLHRYPTALQAPPQPAALQRTWPWLEWRPTAAVAFLLGFGGFFVLLRAVSAAPTEFLYFQF